MKGLVVSAHFNHTFVFFVLWGFFKFLGRTHITNNNKDENVDNNADVMDIS